MPTGGVRPLRACGTRFVAHKVCALERILDRYGAYLNHLIALTEDPKTEPADKQKQRVITQPIGLSSRNGPGAL